MDDRSCLRALDFSHDHVDVLTKAVDLADGGFDVVSVECVPLHVECVSLHFVCVSLHVELLSTWCFRVPDLCAGPSYAAGHPRSVCWYLASRNCTSGTLAL